MSQSLQKIKMGNLQLPDGKERVRPVKAVLMRWALTGETVDKILEKEPRGLAEDAAFKIVENIESAARGTANAMRAVVTLRLLMDGLEEGQVGPSIPVTLIDRVIQTNDGKPSTRVQEVQITGQLSAGQVQEEEQEDGGESERQ